MYLTAASIRQVMVDISRHVKQFTLSLDYVTQHVFAKTTGDPGVTGIAESFAAMGAPWSCSVANTRGFEDEAAMTIEDDIKIKELHRAYWPNEPLDSAIYDHYYLCTLEYAAR
jgi:hypothetical protein